MKKNIAKGKTDPRVEFCLPKFKVNDIQELNQCDLRPIEYLPISGWVVGSSYPGKTTELLAELKK